MATMLRFRDWQHVVSVIEFGLGDSGWVTEPCWVTTDSDAIRSRTETEISATTLKGDHDLLLSFNVQVGRVETAKIGRQYNSVIEAIPLIKVETPGHVQEVTYLISGDAAMGRFMDDALRGGFANSDARAVTLNGVIHYIVTLRTASVYALWPCTQEQREDITAHININGLLVQYGYRHPLQNLLRAPRGRQVFLRPEKPWLEVDTSRTVDVWRTVEIAGAKRQVTAAQQLSPADVKVRLHPAEVNSRISLWCFDNAAVFEDFVTNQDATVAGCLVFVAAQFKDGIRIILRSRRDDCPRPPIGATPYAEYYTGIFGPLNRTCQLSEECLRKAVSYNTGGIHLLADDDVFPTVRKLDQVVWLPLIAWAEMVPSLFPETHTKLQEAIQWAI